MRVGASQELPCFIGIPVLTTTLACTVHTVNLKTLLQELQSMTDWIHFGVFLGVAIRDLMGIRAGHASLLERKSEMLRVWMEGSTEPSTWSGVVQALLDIGMQSLATDIAMKYSKLNCYKYEYRTYFACPFVGLATHTCLCIATFRKVPVRGPTVKFDFCCCQVWPYLLLLL